MITDSELEIVLSKIRFPNERIKFYELDGLRSFKVIPPGERKEDKYQRVVYLRCEDNGTHYKYVFDVNLRHTTPNILSLTIGEVYNAFVQDLKNNGVKL